MEQVLIGTFVFTSLVMFLALVVLAARKLIWGRGRAKFVVNGDKNFDGALGGKLIDSLSSHGVFLPSSCGGAGTCGLCRVRISGGRADDVLPVEKVKLGLRDIKEGYRLACQVVVRGDMDVNVAPEFLGTETWQCTVVSETMLSPLIKEIVLAFPPGQEQELPAGSYAVVNAPAYQLPFDKIKVPEKFEAVWQRMGLHKLKSESREEKSRAYSLVLRPDGLKQMTINIRLAVPPLSHPDAPPGVVSSYLFSLKAGDSLEVVGPFGHFFVQDGDAEMIFIGGGVGMAPLYTHVYDQLQTHKTKRKMSYWYGARSKADLYYEDEMAELAAKHENFTWVPVLSEPADGDDWPGETGFVHAALFENYLKSHPNPETCEYYLCGPPMMIKAVLAMLKKLDVPSENIFSDDFGV